MSDDLKTDLKGLLRETRAELKHLASLEKALSTARSDKDDPAELAAARDILKLIENKSPVYQALVQDVSRRVEKARLKSTMKLIHGLENRHEFTVEKVSDQPLTLRLGDISVECDVVLNRAILRVGREPAAQVDCDVDAIVRVRKEVLEELEKWSTQSPETIFLRLHRAYETCLTLQALTEESRVDLVDLVVPLSWQGSLPTWRQGGAWEFVRFTRYMLVWALYDLRRRGHLEHNGLRLDLGVATGGTTSDKANVLFVPSLGDDGQYYASIRFVKKV